MRKLYRSRRNKMILGLCGGLSDMFRVDATLLRILLVIVTFMSGGTALFIYLIAAMVIPKEPPYYNDYGPDGRFGGHYGNGFDSYTNNHGPRGSQYDSFNRSYNPPPQDSWGARQRKEEPAAGSQFDKMMDDLERKTLRREIDELKSKLAKYEKGE
ncbi:PspC domain-containing protein [Paenibacillus sp. HB172176]|uniref:PspC domain-containing protein n=1 Tax=Paenibacillus sp. HB172176 TaxID=2493690 RepID=UPI0014391197|nr:PspC domain-containing protein [Paenibacillus sp. HB172176]